MNTVHSLRRGDLALALALVFVPIASTRAQTENAVPSASRAYRAGDIPSQVKSYSGLRLRQNPEGVVVVGVLPGPLQGDGTRSPSIWRGDLIVSINGRALDLAGYTALLAALRPGDLLEVAFRRAAAPDPFAAIPRGDSDGELRAVAVVLDDDARWSGTIGQGLPAGRTIAPPPPGAFEDRMLATAGALGLRDATGGLDALRAHLAARQASLLGPGTLPAIAQSMQRPLSLDALEAGIAAQVSALAQPATLASSLAAIQRFLARTLDAEDAPPPPDLATRLGEARRRYQAQAIDLLRHIRDDAAPSNETLPAHLEVLRAGPDLVPLAVGLVRTLALHAASLEQFAREVSQAPQAIPAELQARVRAAVEGPVLGAKLVDDALWIVGGAQRNRYDMALIAAVFDAGGADEYAFTAPGAGTYQIVIDQSGDDRYEATAELAGPASALFSVSLLVDREGDDSYLAYHQGAIATGVLGIAILIDEAGDDRYVNDSAGAGWSQGAGVYGAGLLIDRGGNDVYLGQKLAQGVGGPTGIGLLCDAFGHDTYIANGPHFPSAYGLIGVYNARSQGFGFGLRGYAPGGIGALYDFAGDDQYVLGEFGQGGGYFQGLGILHDAAGHDIYTAARYAQGAAAHQAAGILVDDSGDDVYLGTGPAFQAGAWDQSVAMLVDRHGDDAYAAAGLAQGSAAHQSLAVLIDLDGADRYVCEAQCLGAAGANDYHYATDAVLSFSLLLDLGGAADHYSQPRADNLRLRTGVVIDHHPATSECCGAFVDE